MLNFVKVKKSRYELVISEDQKFAVFLDGWIGLWRIIEEGGPRDWAGPFRTLSQAKELLERKFGE